MERIKEKVGARIRQFRKAQKLTQAQLAENADLSIEHIGAIERGDRSPSLEVLEKISQALNIPLKDIFDFPSPISDQDKLLLELNSLLKDRAIDQIESILDFFKRIFRE